MDQLFRTLITLVDSVEDCLAKGRYMPALMLIYSGIDVVARLEVPLETPAGQPFKDWANRYFLKQKQFTFSAGDLYAARCGILHQLSVDSKLTKTNKAKRIVYATGAASAKALQEIANSKGLDCFAVHLSDLNEAFRYAIADYVGEVVADASRRNVVEEALKLWFTNIAV